VTKRGIETRIFHAIWWTLAMLLPDLLGFALRDWRAAVAGAAASIIMIVLSVRVFMRGETTWPEVEPMLLGGPAFTR
jgi:hypothetical protein